jgi:ABC-2 type transport system ATP-binding protein
VSFAYGSRTALDRASFDVDHGELVALLGPNGAGKTTLVSLICRLFEPQHGQIDIEGRPLSVEKHRALQGLGIVFQERSLDLDLTVEQNLQYAAALRGLSRREARTRIADELERADLGEQRSTRVGLLNGGHRRRVEIARAFLHRPRVLLCDEATVGLDIPARRALLSHVRHLLRDEKVSILWTTHLAAEIEPSDRLVVLHRGRVVGNEPAAGAVARYGSVERAFEALTASP